MIQTLLSWSSGKDSAWALHTLRQNPNFDLAGIFCTVNQAFQRVAMHAVRVALLQRQAQALGLPLAILEIPNPCSHDEYAQVMADFVGRARAEGVRQFAFGDLYLEDIRAYREQNLQGSGIDAIFPLWQKPTAALAREMVDSGLRAIITAVDPRKLPPSFAGREFDHALLDDLPADVDPCGENGEFHSFVYAGPMFSEAIPVRVVDVVERDGFIFADVIPIG
jgi:uncharacterized protein (TIGR00290 family)